MRCTTFSEEAGESGVQEDVADWSAGDAGVDSSHAAHHNQQQVLAWKKIVGTHAHGGSHEALLDDEAAPTVGFRHQQNKVQACYHTLNNTDRPSHQNDVAEHQRVKLQGIVDTVSERCGLSSSLKVPRTEESENRV
ncbi:hypothetical protein ACSX1A_10900 [Pontibacter sp. MBLB2868]|uniref:hypothetical protein n=1 Tax=Pontibacter sp. MBLB2868 TaxID=3451555 RepID=UPI003F75436B